MISESNTGVIAGEWFNALPTDADRDTVTGIVAMAYEFDWQNHMHHYDSRHSAPERYLGVYAIGSRSLGQEGPDSDIDVLVAHNLAFDSGCDGRKVSFTRDVDFDAFTWPHDGGDENDPEYLKYRAAQRRERSFDSCLETDPVSSAVCSAVANAADDYRLPHTFDGQLPDNYQYGGVDHKAFVRYARAGELSPLDLVLYKGWHSAKNPSPDTIEEVRRYNEEHEGEDDIPLPQRSVCGPKCKEIELREGATPEKFEQIIDTDSQGDQLPRVPLYTFADRVKEIYIPQIAGLIVDEQRAADDRETGWKFRRSWLKHTIWH